MSGERAEAEKSGGKPCQGMGNLIRLLAKRKADEEALRSADADEGVEESPSKRDIRVSTKLTSESEDGRHRKHSRNPAPDDPLPSLRLHTTVASLMAELVAHGQ